MRPSKVIYDRANSAISEAEPCDFDFDAIMEEQTGSIGQVLPQPFLIKLPS